MRRWALPLILHTALGAGGCGDSYSLDVVVDNAAGVTIARTEVSVYEGTATCEGVKFGDLTPQDLEPALVDRVTLVNGGEDTAALSNLSRTDPKLVVARAFGPDQTLVAIGCAEVGEVTGRDTVTVSTQLAAIASVAFVDRTMDPTGIQVFVADARGHALDGREVSWRVYGPVGSGPSRTTGVAIEPDATWSASAPSCSTGGVTLVHPVPPAVTGGYAIQARVAWASDRVPLLSSINVDPSPAQFGSVSGVKHPCAIGRTSAGPRLVCVTGASEISTFTVGTTGVLGAPGTTTLPFSPVGLYAAPSGSDTGVFAMGSGGELSRVFPSVATLPCTTCGALAIDDVVALPSCGGTTPFKAIVHTAGTGMTELRWVDATGGTMSGFPFSVAPGFAVTLGAAGCVTTIAPSTGVQTLVPAIAIEYAIAGTTLRSRLMFDCTASTCAAATLPASGAGVGFSADPAPALLTASLDATGVVLLRTVLARTSSGGGDLIELARQPSAALPHRIVSAQLDEDGLADLLWDETLGRVPALQLSYAREVQGAPLSALTLLTKNTDAGLLDILAGEVTGDGHDDLVLVSSQALTNKLGLLVIPSQIANTLATPADPTCP